MNKLAIIAALAITLNANAQPQLHNIIDGKRNGEAIVYEASDAEQAIEILDTEYIDAIITDIHLPKQSGWDLLKYVRNVENLKHLPTYSTTASIDLPESTHGLTFDGALPKPFNEDDLIALLGQHFGR